MRFHLDFGQLSVGAVSRTLDVFTFCGKFITHLGVTLDLSQEQSDGWLQRLFKTLAPGLQDQDLCLTGSVEPYYT